MAAALAVSAASADSPTLTLNNGLAFPKVSFGLQVYDDDTAKQYTLLALQAGIRNFFSSVLAGNQIGFGNALGASTVARKDIFVCGSADTASCSGFDDCRSQTAQACQTNLDDIGSGGGLGGYVDMIMLDYPSGDCDSILGQWAAFEDMLKNGTTKSIAVSNFSPDQIDCIVKNSTSAGAGPGRSSSSNSDVKHRAGYFTAQTPPAVNQLSYSVGHGSDTSVADDAARGGVVVQAYSPLSGGILPQDPDCIAIGKSHNKSAAQVALRWILQRNATFTTSASSLEHFQDDLAIFDFALTDAEMATLNAK